MSDGFIAAYAGVTLTLPDGRTVTAKAISVAQQAKLLRLFNDSSASDVAGADFIETFPALIGLEAELQGLHLLQLFRLYKDFCSGAGLIPLPSPPAASPPLGTT